MDRPPSATSAHNSRDAPNRCGHQLRRSPSSLSELDTRCRNGCDRLSQSPATSIPAFASRNPPSRRNNLAAYRCRTPLLRGIAPEERWLPVLSRTSVALRLGLLLPL